MGRDSAKKAKIIPVKLKRDNFARKSTLPFTVPPCPSALGNLPDALTLTEWPTCGATRMLVWEI